MKKLFKIITLFLSALFVLSLCGCGAEPIPKYNTAVGNRIVDKIDAKSVIENALLADVFENIDKYVAVASVYDEIAKVEKGKKTTYFVLASVAGYFAENGKLNRNRGTSPFAVAIELKQTKNGYVVTDFKTCRTAETKEERNAFIAEYFPEGTDPEAVFNGKRQGLLDKEQKQILENYEIAQKYGFTGNEDMLEFVPLSNEAYMAVREFFYIYPDWLGSQEKVENGVRYTYSTTFIPEGNSDEKGVLLFLKTDEEGVEVERYEVKIDGNNVQLPDNFTEGQIESTIELPKGFEDLDAYEGFMENLEYDDGIDYYFEEAIIEEEPLNEE